jgi:hypothetical protein
MRCLERLFMAVGVCLMLSLMACQSSDTGRRTFTGTRPELSRERIVPKPTPFKGLAGTLSGGTVVLEEIGGQEVYVLRKRTWQEGKNYKFVPVWVEEDYFDTIRGDYVKDK